MEQIKIRCSSLGKITVLDRATQLTPIQWDKLARLEKKRDEKGLTEPQKKELKSLISKRDAPDALSEGAKTHIQDIFYSRTFNFRRSFTNKFTQKGHEVEQKSIDQVCQLVGLPIIMKNTERKENDYIQGECDAVVPTYDLQFDVKSVYYPHNLGAFDDKPIRDYEWQGKGYCWLYGVENALWQKSW